VKWCRCRAMHQSPGDYSACAMKRRRAVMMGCADTIHALRRCLDAACSCGRAWKGEAPHSGAAAALASAPRPTSPATRALRPERANAELPWRAHAHTQQRSCSARATSQATPARAAHRLARELFQLHKLGEQAAELPVQGLQLGRLDRALRACAAAPGCATGPVGAPSPLPALSLAQDTLAPTGRSPRIP